MSHDQILFVSMLIIENMIKNKDIPPLSVRLLDRIKSAFYDLLSRIFDINLKYNTPIKSVKILTFFSYEIVIIFIMMRSYIAIV